MGKQDLHRSIGTKDKKAARRLLEDKQVNFFKVQYCQKKKVKIQKTEKWAEHPYTCDVFFPFILYTEKCINISEGFLIID